MAVRAELQQAYLLHSRPYRDTSLLVDILSREHGRVSLVARGVRRAKSRSQSLLQPFSPLLISWSGNHDLKTFTGVERNGPLRWLAGRCMASAFYINELLLRLIDREDPHPLLYDYYAAMLDRLQAIANTDDAEQAALMEEVVLRLFEKQLLEELGYALVLDHDVRTGSILNPQQDYTYILHHGPTLQNQDDAEHTMPVVRVSGAALLALQCGELTERRQLRECKQLMRMVMKPLLGPRPLHSRRLFRSLHTSGPPSAAEEPIS